MWQIKAKSGHILSTQVTNLSQYPSCTLLRPKCISTWPVFKALKLKSTHRLNYVTNQKKIWSHFTYPGYLFILAMRTVLKAIMVKSTHRWDLRCLACEVKRMKGAKFQLIYGAWREKKEEREQGSLSLFWITKRAYLQTCWSLLCDNIQMFLLRVGLYQNRYDGQYWRMFYQHLKQNIFLPKQMYFMYKSRYLFAFGRQIGEVTNIWLWVTKKTSSSLFSTTVRRDLQQPFVNRNINYSFFFWGIILPRSINLLRENLVSNQKTTHFTGFPRVAITWMKILNYSYIKKVCKSLSKSLLSISENA